MKKSEESRKLDKFYSNYLKLKEAHEQGLISDLDWHKVICVSQELLNLYERKYQ